MISCTSCNNPVKKWVLLQMTLNRRANGSLRLCDPPKVIQLGLEYGKQGTGIGDKVLKIK